ncbi:aminotransferase class V-fold PLP-dependent enzyme [Reichenbachiella agarivorans]|uniref:Aminotransferase class V-fold PLP-dependent enzyme n=1 Tax=Reichenbachiella agarivorans TaxID=2979464 RepID=A0ABY6CZ19_9BACT|nr:aminotransferase class V-fold PLP-dependent enzyme [Reichenbachiella agarivorans]UXP33480.1 aminotransferase class V-fold PLP-dependent enzyme [Reichenbachiella agarivorans]
MNCQKNKFLLNKKYAYLNCAYMAPQLKKVEKAGRKGLTKKRQPNLITPDDFFHDLNTIKMLFSELTNAGDKNRITLIPSASYGIANVVNNISLTKGDNVVVAGDQFPSNVYPWMNACQAQQAELKIVTAPESTENRGKIWNEKILNSIDSKTKAVALGHVHWADGTLFELIAIRKKCDEVGAALVIDGTQSVGALPFDIQEIKPDALIVAAYKWLLGPYSVGVAYYGERFDQGKPIEQNWINRLNSENFAELVNYRNEYQSGADRYGVGERSNFILNPMLIESFKQILQWQPANIQEYCKNLMAPAIEEIRSKGYYIEDESQRASHLFGIKIPTDKMDALAKALKNHKVSASIRGSFLRVSPHVYNDQRDVNKLLRAFRSIGRADS